MTGSVLSTAEYFRQQHLAGNVPAYEEHLKAAYRKFVRRGDFCVDVGVHAGEHLLELRRLGATTVGYEPLVEFDPGGCGMIRRFAVSSRPSHSQRFHLCTDAAGESGLKERRPGSTVERFVPVTTLDREMDILFWRKGPRYIKIDTEGHDLDVLEGAAQTITQDRPIISVEFSAATFKAHGRWDTDLWEWAERMDYRVGDLWGNLVEDLAEWRQVVDKSYWDYLLWPSEKSEWRLLTA